MKPTKIETRTVDIPCPFCENVAKGMSVPVGSTVMVACGRCGERFEFAETLHALASHDHQTILDFVRRGRYASSASHVDATAFRARQKARAVAAKGKP